MIDSLDIPTKLHHLYLNGWDRNTCFCCANSESSNNSNDSNDSNDSYDSSNENFNGCLRGAHRKYCMIMGLLEHAQSKLIQLLIKINTDKLHFLNIDELRKTFALDDRSMSENSIFSCFPFKTCYYIYFECYGKPEKLEDVAIVNPHKIEAIICNLKNRDSISSELSTDSQLHSSIGISSSELSEIIADLMSESCDSVY